VISHRGREMAGVVAVFAAIAVVTTLPLVGHIGSALPAGLGDPVLVTYVLAWDADRIAHGFRNFWQTPYLFPHSDTLAYSEHMLGLAVFTAPLQWATRNPVLVYNVAFLGSYVLAGLGVYLLTRLLWGRGDAAWLAGLAFMLSPYRTGQVTHLQVLMAGWMPLSLWALHHYLASGSRRALAAFAAAFLLQALSNGYYLFFFSLAVSVVVLVELVCPRLPRRRLLGELAAALVLVGVLLCPFAWTYLRVQRQNAFARGADDLFHYAARLVDYVSVPPDGWTWGGLLRAGEPERQLYPGLFALGCAVVGLATGFSSPAAAVRQENRPTWTRSIVTYALVGLTALSVSLGPGAWRPYGLLLRIVPGFSGMRVPARAGIIVHLALIVLGAAGAARLLGRLPRRVALITAVTLGAIILVEGHAAPSVDPFPPIERRLDRAAYEWLRDSPPGAAIELRITQQNDFHPFTLFYQFNTRIHHHRIVNGYSGWPSVLQEFLGGPAAPFDDPAAIPDVLHALRAIGVRYLLLHEWTYTDPEQPARIAAAIRAAPDQTIEERRFDRTVVWRLADIAPRPPGPAAASREKIDPASLTVAASHVPERLRYIFDGNVETRWITGTRQTGGEWLEIRLQQPADVASLRLETSPRGLIDYPRHLVIESIDENGAPQRLYDASVLARLIEALAVDDRRAPIELELAPNRTQILRLRQTGRTHRWFWGVHELSLFRR
jgi:hypothetical protein